MITVRKFIVLACLLAFTHLSMADSGRWYNPGQVVQGQALFQQNCASCHGANAESVANWKQGDSNGKALPPPLNGTAHSWHHSLKQLKKTIQQGSIQIGGSMPAFDSLVDESEIDALIAYFQSKWPEQTYRQWATQFKVADRKSNTADMASLLKLRLGLSELPEPTETPVAGVYQTRIGDKYAYLIENGRFVFIGDLIDLKTALNITEMSRGELARDKLAQVSPSDMVIYQARNTEKAILNVFTDTSCAYCQKLHQEVHFLQDAGITVRYFPYPRGGNRGPGYQDLKRVWCADDKVQAMDIAKGIANGELGSAACAEGDFVDRGYELGNSIGISGTPALFFSSGQKVNGYVPHQRLIGMLLKGQ